MESDRFGQGGNIVPISAAGLEARETARDRYLTVARFRHSTPRVQIDFTPPPGFEGNTTLSLAAQSVGAAFAAATVTITSGIFLVTNTNDSDPGSLRQAILDSNAATGGTNTIEFAIPAAGVQVIAPLSPLPAIVNPVLIDGFSQPGYTGTPLIELSGSQTDFTAGLTITGSDVTIRGLAVGGFSGAAAFSSRVLVQPATSSKRTISAPIRPAHWPCQTHTAFR